MNCPCDEKRIPGSRKIAAGLKNIPRQAATFPEFRTAMLAAIRKQPALYNWQATGKNDLGIMLLEMWAYICDVLSFYDELIAHESYIRTARHRSSLRKLVGLLGYIPNPAIASVVELAILVEERKTVKLPAGTAFRSGAFEDQPPQVYELDSDTRIHPFTNNWTIQPQKTPGVLLTNPVELLLKKGTGKFKVDEAVLLMIKNGSDTKYVRTVNSITECKHLNGREYDLLQFNKESSNDINLNGEILLQTPTQIALLWTRTTVKAIDGKTIPLNGLYHQISSGMTIIISNGGIYKWFEVVGVEEKQVEIQAGSENYPPTFVPITVLEINESLDDISDIKKIIIYYNLIENGLVAFIDNNKMEPLKSLVLNQHTEIPEDSKVPEHFLLEDINQTGQKISGSLNNKDNSLSISEETPLQSVYTHPVQLFGNIVQASRGESVHGEILGSGDASISNQSFKLSKKPLTYLYQSNSSGETGPKSTLKIHVNGIQWKEVPSFYNVPAISEVYIVRQNDEGDSFITFGNGINGARLPNGVDNIIADYRFGAGAAKPPAGSITQLVKPVQGVLSVKNPLAAIGGDDAQSSKKIRSYAPKSALLLGRGVSVQDFEVVAANVPGVSYAVAEWGWHEMRQGPAVNVWYIGDEGLESMITESLVSVSELSTTISVQRADPNKIDSNGKDRLSIKVKIIPRYRFKNVEAELLKVLFTENAGLLIPEQLGIGKPLFRSQLCRIIFSVKGIDSIIEIKLNGDDFAYFEEPDSGKYFDFMDHFTIEPGELANE